MTLRDLQVRALVLERLALVVAHFREQTHDSVVIHVLAPP